MVYAVIFAMAVFIVSRLIMFIINNKRVKKTDEIDDLLVRLINEQRS